jgi:hypothetical protein
VAQKYKTYDKRLKHYQNGKNKATGFFTPLESPAACPVRSLASIGACSEDEDKILFGASAGFKTPCEPSH